MYTTSLDGEKWSTPNDIVAPFNANGRYATRPALLVDAQGILHLTYRGDTIWYTNSPIPSADIATSWRDPIQVAVAGYFSRLALDSKGRLHLFYTVNVPQSNCQNCFHLMYESSVDGGITWSYPIDIYGGDGGVAKPQILIDNSNNIHVVFEAGYGGDLGQLEDPATVMYVGSHDGGNTWSYPVRLDPKRGDDPTNQARNVTIGLTRNDELVTAWWGIPDDQIFYQTSNDYGVSWSSPKPIPGVWGIWSVYNSRLDDYTMATDNAGQIHLVMVGRLNSSDTKMALLHVMWNGKEWSRPENIKTFDGDVPEWPRVAISHGNQLNVVWFVRDKEHIWGGSDNTDYNVWYAKSVASAPVTESVLLPTPIPLMPTPNVKHEIGKQVVTTTLLDSGGISLSRSLQQGIDPRVTIESIRSENKDVLVLVKSLLPSILLFTGAAVVVGIRRRKKSN